MTVKTMLMSIAMTGFTTAYAGYTRLSYLDCNRDNPNATSSTSGSWVKITGYKPQGNERFRMTFADRGTSVNGAYMAFFSARTGSDSVTAFQAWKSTTTWMVRFDFKGGNRAHKDTITTDSNTHTIEWAGLDGNKQAWGYIDDVKDNGSFGSGDNFTSGGDLVLFATPDGAGYKHTANFRFFDLIVRNQAMQMIHHFVPARDDSAASNAKGRYGVYDTVTDTFYPNIGNRDFLVTGATECGTLGVKPVHPIRHITAGDIVENVGVKSVPLSFDNPGYAQKLYLAWGDADGGDATNTWEHVEALAEVGANESARNVNLPAAAKKVRFFLYPVFAGGTVVESLNSTGVDEYINTGITPNEKTRTDATFEVLNGTFLDRFGAPFGARLDGNTQYFVLAISVNENGLVANTWHGRRRAADYARGVGDPGIYGNHEVSIDRNVYIIDGRTNTFTDVSAFSAGCNMYALCANQSNSLKFRMPMKLKTLDIWDDDRLVRSYIPCLKDGTTPALYDTVNGTYAYNGGSTPLMTGPAAQTTPTLLTSPNAVVYAWWTGAGNDGNVSNPANWACTNGANARLNGALPDESSLISIGNCTLDRDLDFRSLPATLQIAGTVDLNGHTLRLTHFAGEGTITDKTGYTTFAQIITHGAEYVLTDYVPVSTDRIETEMLFQRNDATHGIWCARGGTYGETDTMTLFINSESLRFDYETYNYDTHRFVTPLVPSKTVWHTLVMDGNRRCAYDNGAVVADFGGSNAFTCGGPLMLFASYTGSTANFGNRCNEVFMRRFQVFAPDNTLKLNLQPRMRNSDGQLGLYDTVSGKFYNDVGGYDFRRPVANDATGTLVVDVPEGQTIVNETVTLAGGLKLIKRGAGTFTAAKRGQSFTGGAIIEAGTAMSAKSPAATSLYYTEYNTLWGARIGLLQVEDGATFDTQGNYEFYFKNIVLNGGTLANTGCAMADRNQGSFGDITLNASSTLFLQYNTTLTREGYTIDLGGHELLIDFTNVGAAALFGKPSQGVVTNGTIVIDAQGECNAGRMLSFKASVDMRTVDLHQKDAQIQIDDDVVVKLRNYLTDCTTHAARSTVPFEIYGTFTPRSQMFNGVVMQNGSRIDLRGKTEPWSIMTGCPEQPSNRCAFADGAKVIVDISGRNLPNGTKVIDWSGEGQKPANLNSVSFKPVAGSAYGFVKQDDGLYVYGRGSVIKIR